MPRRIEVLERVRMMRILATADMPAREADAQLRPRRSDREALLATVRPRRHVFGNLGEMLAAIGHFISTSSSSTINHMMAQFEVPSRVTLMDLARRLTT